MPGACNWQGLAVAVGEVGKMLLEPRTWGAYSDREEHNAFCLPRVDRR
jgi:hypothetical protein